MFKWHTKNTFMLFEKLLRNKFSISSPNLNDLDLEFDDYITWFITIYGLKVERSVFEYKLKFEFKQIFERIELYHGCRTFSLGDYYKYGLEKLDIELLFERIKPDLQKRDTNFSEEKYEHTRADFDDERKHDLKHRNVNTGPYFCIDKEHLMKQRFTDCLYGELGHHFLNKYFHEKEDDERSFFYGSLPLVIAVAIPVCDLPNDKLTSLCEHALKKWADVDIKNHQQSRSTAITGRKKFDRSGFSLQLKENVPPQVITRHFHIKNDIQHSYEAYCKMCHRTKKHPS